MLKEWIWMDYRGICKVLHCMVYFWGVSVGLRFEGCFFG